QYGTIQDRRHDLLGPFVSVTTKENIEKIYFEQNPNASIRKAAQRILKHFLKMHPYKITTYQLLIERARTKHVEFCKTINVMFEDGELDEKLIIFTGRAHFWLNGVLSI
ncbi:hypothetical protein ALC60_11852, partial [Trachymyrmex zeteki]